MSKFISCCVLREIPKREEIRRSPDAIMVEQLAKDYSQYFRKLDVGKEIKPICASIEEMMARLEEFESLLATVKIDSHSSIQESIPQMLAQKDDFDRLCQQIDNLEKIVATVNESVSAVEQCVEIAEEELGISDYSLKGLLKPLFNKAKSSDGPRTNLLNGEFKAPAIFKTSDYFGDGCEGAEGAQHEIKS